MAKVTIQVDLYNPGQVFACIGLMEMAEAFDFEEVEAGFEWSSDNVSKFNVTSVGNRDLFREIIHFLCEATAQVIAPCGVVGPWPEDVTRTRTFPSPSSELRKSDGKGYSASALPLALTHDLTSLPISNWLEGDGRNSLKTFAGNQVAAKLLRNLLGTDTEAVGIRQMFGTISEHEAPSSFEKVGAVSGRFCFDARGAWDALGLGTSLDTTGTLVKVSPLVEVLAIIGLENARPDFLDTYTIRYSVWSGSLPTSLARAALSCAMRILPAQQVRNFRASLGSDKQYKKCFSSREIV